MKREIERRFLVPDLQAIPDWHTVSAVAMRQGYLHSEPGCTVRVRLAGERAWLTIKGPTQGAGRDEFEYAIPVDDAIRLLELAACGRVIKQRRVVWYAGLEWEVDEFFGDNAGLILAEVELDTEDQPVELPPWVGGEVTADKRYTNAALARLPWHEWPSDKKTDV